MLEPMHDTQYHMILLELEDAQCIRYANITGIDIVTQLLESTISVTLQLVGGLSQTAPCCVYMSVD